jgi:nucleotide-binding universal stress UspA family protein
MYKTILAPLDGSKRAEAILPHLEQLAGRYKAKVIFLQAIQQSMLFVRPETADIEQKE